MPSDGMFKPGYCSGGHFQDAKTYAVRVRSSRLSFSWVGLPLALNGQSGDGAHFCAACPDLKQGVKQVGETADGQVDAGT